MTSRGSSFHFADQMINKWHGDGGDWGELIVWGCIDGWVTNDSPTSITLRAKCNCNAKVEACHSLASPVRKSFDRLPPPVLFSWARVVTSCDHIDLQYPRLSIGKNCDVIMLFFGFFLKPWKGTSDSPFWDMDLSLHRRGWWSTDSAWRAIIITD